MQYQHSVASTVAAHSQCSAAVVLVQYSRRPIAESLQAHRSPVEYQFNAGRVPSTGTASYQYSTSTAWGASTLCTTTVAEAVQSHEADLYSGSTVSEAYSYSSCIPTSFVPVQYQCPARRVLAQFLHSAVPVSNQYSAGLVQCSTMPPQYSTTAASVQYQCSSSPVPVHCQYSTGTGPVPYQCSTGTLQCTASAVPVHYQQSTSAVPAQ